MMFVYPKRYQVLVVGGGHAGIEAAMAAARLGCETMMLTQNLDTIGQMSCNPAVGGLAKGHMVREIDALGGVMGLNTDATGIQFRTLNSNKGPSVRAPRAQCDKKAYQFRMKALLEGAGNLELLQGNVLRILEEGGQVKGIETTLGLQIYSEAVIITTGTFMRGLLHVGLQNQAGGRMGDGVSTVSESLRAPGWRRAASAVFVSAGRAEERSRRLFHTERVQGGSVPRGTNALLDYPYDDPNPRHHSCEPGQVSYVFRPNRRDRTSLLPLD